MSIHTRWGGDIPVEIVANCGSHQPPYFILPSTLVKIKYQGEDRTRFYWYDLLRATSGLDEIKKALKAAPTIKLTKVQARKAYAEAE